MKGIVLKYGGLSALVLLGTCVINYALSHGDADYTKQEIVGNLSIFLSMLFVFFGMWQYRDKVNGGAMTFGQGLKIGALIAVFPSIDFGIINVIYVKYIDTGFVEKYYNFAMQKLLEKKLPPAELESKLKAMQSQKEIFSNVPLSFLLMMVNAFIIGIIVSVISALILQRKKQARLV